MQDETKRLILRQADVAVKSRDLEKLGESYKSSIEAMMDCQIKTSERTKAFGKAIDDMKTEILEKIDELNQNFQVCPARMNDVTDHSKIAELEKRIGVIEQNVLIEKTQRETIGRMAKALYAIGGVVGGAGLLKGLEIVGKIVS